MKKSNLLILLSSTILLLLNTCKDDDVRVEPASVITLEVTEITTTTARSGGNITNDGGGEITARGVVWSTSQNPTTEQNTGSTADGSGSGIFQSDLTGLTEGTVYYVRAYTINTAGAAYGNQIQFSTGSLPLAAFEATPVSGKAPLTVVFTDQSTNNPTTWLWDFGDGINSAEQNPEHTYQEAGDFTVQLTVSNDFGSDTKTKADYIEVEAAGGVPNAAFSGTPSMGIAPLTVNFTDQSTYNPTSWQWDFGDGNTSTQQSPEHTYQNAGFYTVQLEVSNNYGGDSEIKNNYIIATTIDGIGQPCPGMPSVTDIDGNVYNTVLIGEQCWMKENLRTTRYRNGASIAYPGSNNNTWKNNTTGAYAWHDNNINWGNSYGAMYNWYAVNNANGLCPEGWHVPDDDEWTQLIDHVTEQGFPNSDVLSGAGNALKSCRQIVSPLGGECAASEHPRWNPYYNRYGFDAFGFSALPASSRGNFGHFSPLGEFGNWWSSTEYLSSFAWRRDMGFTHGQVNRYYTEKSSGISVRCIRD